MPSGLVVRALVYITSNLAKGFAKILAQIIEIHWLRSIIYNKPKRMNEFCTCDSNLGLRL